MPRSLKNAPNLTVIIGPSTELHSGVHGSLLQHPPGNVSYLQAPYRYHYLFPTNERVSFDPFTGPSVSETIFYDEPQGSSTIVHSSRVPVFNAVPWIADTDCLLSTILYGRFFIIGSELQIRNKTLDERLIRLRAQVMLSHYANDNCKGLLFRTAYARSRATQYIQHAKLLTADRVELLLSKMDVVYPTLPAAGTAEMETEKKAISIVYMGRTFEDKGGEIALHAFAKLKARFGQKIELNFVGPVPRSFSHMLEGVMAVPIMEREEYLKLLKRSHIFFSPTAYESYGMGLIEAAGQGLAIITTCGTGMEHVEELFENGKNGYFVPNEWPKGRKVEAFVNLVARLVTDTNELRVMRETNLSLVSRGKLSLQNRNKKLLHYYNAMKQDVSAPISRKKALDSVRRKYRLGQKLLPELYFWLENAARTGGQTRRIRI